MTTTTDKDGLYVDAPSMIATYGGGRLDPLNPDPADITIGAIAHSLAQQCRWTGHCSRFYSVAEHCVHVSRMVPGPQALAALLHDASEAFLSDLARPIKHAPGLGVAYLEVEHGLEAAIAERFECPPPPMSAEIKAADNAMLQQEANELVPHLGAIMPDPPEGTPVVQCWTPPQAEAIFLDTFYYHAR